MPCIRNTEKLKLGTKLSFLKKQIIFFWAVGLFALLQKGLILFQNTTPARAHFIKPNFGPFFVENIYVFRRHTKFRIQKSKKRRHAAEA